MSALTQRTQWYEYDQNDAIAAVVKVLNGGL